MTRRETKPLLLNDLNIYMPVERSSQIPSRGYLLFIALDEMRPSMPYSVRRRKFWQIFVMLCVLAIIAGTLFGFNH